MRRKKKDKNNINNQEEIDLIPIESQQEETEVGTQPDAEPENPEATAEDTSDASLETETEVESIKPEAESAEPERSLETAHQKTYERRPLSSARMYRHQHPRTSHASSPVLP